jgi:outer membrane protein TolC
MLKKLLFLSFLFFIFVLKSSFIFASNHAGFETKISSSSLVLEDAISISKKNRLDFQIATKEKLTKKLALRKNLRDFFPSASIVYDESTGKNDLTTGKAGFIEKKYGLQFSQPIYKSGNIKNQYFYAKKNSEIAELSEKLINNEVKFSVQEAYYNLLILNMKKNIYNDCFIELVNYTNMAENLFNKSFISKKEIYSCKIISKNFEYETKEINIEIKKYLSKLEQSMGVRLDDNIKTSLDIDSMVDEYKKKYSDIKFDETFNKIMTNNYKLKIEKLSLEASSLASKIAKKEQHPSINLEGFFGNSASNYDTEPLDYKQDYKLTMNLEYSFGGNKLKASDSMDRSSPKMGDTTRTDVDSQAYSVGILDDMERNTGKSTKELDELKQLKKYKDTVIEIENKTKDDLFNIEKYLLKIENSKEAFDLAKIKFEIVNVKFNNGNLDIEELMNLRKTLSELEFDVYQSKILFIIAVLDLEMLLG